MENINIKDINSDLYSIKLSEQRYASILYVDFHYDKPKMKSAYGNVPIIGPDVFTMTTTLNELHIDVDLETPILTKLQKNLNDKFALMAFDLGKKHRFELSITEERKQKLQEIMGIPTKNVFDIVSIDQAILKIHAVQNLIAVNGRIGEGEYILMNEKTYNKYIERLQEPVNIKFIIDDNIPDNAFVMGRKTTQEQPGILGIILTDKLGNIAYNITDDKVKLTASLVSIGFHPQRQFYTFFIKC